jgi:uncharacterized membrane protein
MEVSMSESALPEQKPAKKDKPEVQVVESSISIEHYEGPTPHPLFLQKLEEVVPGAAKNVLDDFLHQSKHRRELEAVVIPNQVKQSNTGQWMGFITGIFGLSAATFLAYTGHDVVAGVIGGTTVLGLVSTFVFGKRKQKEDLDSKSD